MQLGVNGGETMAYIIDRITKKVELTYPERVKFLETYDDKLVEAILEEMERHVAIRKRGKARDAMNIVFKEFGY